VPATRAADDEAVFDERRPPWPPTSVTAPVSAGTASRSRRSDALRHLPGRSATSPASIPRRRRR